MEPQEFHERVKDPNTIVLDCRNKYESDIGRFKTAVPLNTTTFKDSWDSLSSVLADVPKNTSILTYCTGGIRCVKVCLLE